MMHYLPSDHTFVVCAYKENPYLESAIQSILNQNILGELVVSTSTPNQYIVGMCDRLGVELIVNPKPRSAGDDWNYGYDFANTPLVTMVHQDDYYDPCYLESILNTLNDRCSDGASIVFTDYFEIRDNQNVYENRLLKIKRVMNAPFAHSCFNGSRFVKRCVLSFGSSICCPAVTLVKENLGGSVFETKYKNSCDYHTWVKLASNPGRFIYIPQKLMGHRIYAESATSINLSNDIRRKEDEEILSMLWPKPFARLINRIYAKSEKSNEL